MAFKSGPTIKSDWLNHLLASKGFCVSGHPRFSEMLNLETDVAVVLRHFRLASEATPRHFLLTMTLSQQSKVWPRFKEAAASPTYQALCQTFRGMLLPLMISHDATQFSMDDVTTMTADQLRDYFGSINASFTTNVGAAKPINVSSNDSFSDWTRTHLTRSAVINDIDAIYLPQSGRSGVVVELKRPRQTFELGAWGPFKADASNYASQAAIAKLLGLEDRTIAYHALPPDGEPSSRPVALFMDIAMNEHGRMTSRRALCSACEATSVPLQITGRFHKHESRF